MFQCIIVFLYAIKSFKKVLLYVPFNLESSSLPQHSPESQRNIELIGIVSYTLFMEFFYL